MRGFYRLHACFPMLVSQGIPDSVGLSSCAQQRSVVGVGLEIGDREEEGQSDEDHGLPHLLIIFPPS